MTLESLKLNLEHEKKIINELSMLMKQAERRKGREKALIDRTITSLINQLKIINNSIPSILEHISPIKKLKPEEEKVKGLASMSYEHPEGRRLITVKESDKRKFLEELSLSDINLERIKKEYKVEKVKSFTGFKKPNPYAKLSNKFFSGISEKLIERGKFSSLNLNLRKANLPFLLNTYISMMFFTILISIFIAIGVFVLLIFFDVSINSPFLVKPAVMFTLARMLRNVLVSLAIPVLTLICFYFYPYTEQQSMGGRIDQELPFVVIHMAAIAGSGIEPSQIFKIIALGKDYPYTSQEIKKVINQVNIYGYDLVNALRNSARNTSSNRLAELFNGLATTISSGGSLTEFLDKRAETLLFDYKLDKEKATKVAETFMDIYISIVIAAPMIMMLLLILISVSGMSIGLSIDALTIIILLIVALINIVFLIFLHIEQPKY